MTKNESFLTMLDKDQVPATREKTRKKQRSKYKLLSAGNIVLFGIFTLLLAFIVFTNIKIDDRTQEVSDLNEKLQALELEEAELEERLSEKIDLAEIEKTVTEEYGMVKSDDLPSRYVSVSSEDKIQVVEIEEDEEEVTFNIFSVIGRTFRTVLEYIEN